MNDVLEHLLKKLQDEQLRQALSLGDGSAKDYADYKYSCGVVRGLLIASNHISELAERLEKADE